MSCIFCAIAKGEIESDIVWRGENAVAFLDNRPLFHGHVLLVPTTHVTTLKELPAAEVGPIFQAAQAIELAVETALDCEGTFIAINNIVSQSVPHLHIHVVPRRKGDGLKGFFWPRHPYASDAERKEIAAKIAAALAGQNQT